LFQAHLEKVENEIAELSQNAKNLKSNYVELVELKHVLQWTQLFLNEVGCSQENLICNSEGVRCSISSDVTFAYAEFRWRISCEMKILEFDRASIFASREAVMLAGFLSQEKKGHSCGKNIS